ncbi:unnamed protein product [Litomosoides sigmodontis]|uniref:Uncharacterized protein n=1 Tax=Litomosoides sigmodontis TaxID=42156 RepID=A0A3P6T3L1_LITSI|nr:unnamed protein product [Litomosoides sigmodontis]
MRCFASIGNKRLSAYGIQLYNPSCNVQTTTALSTSRGTYHQLRGWEKTWHKEERIKQVDRSSKKRKGTAAICLHSFFNFHMLLSSKH